jgi:hypothetical protein
MSKLKQYSISELQMHPYQTAMQMVHERALEIAKWEKENRPAPELPDGYRVDSILDDLTLSHWEGRMVACLYRTGELGIPARVASAKDTEAIAAFLQGAR